MFFKNRYYTIVGDTMSGTVGKVLKALAFVISALMLVVYNTINFNENQQAAINDETMSQQAESSIVDCDPNSISTTAGFTDTGDLTVTTRGKDDKGNNINITTVSDSDFNIKSKTKTVTNKDEKTTTWVWDPDFYGKGKGGWKKTSGMPSSPE